MWRCFAYMYDCDIIMPYAYRGQRYSLGQELQVVLSFYVGARIEPESSTKAASAHNHRANSPDP